MEKFFSFLKGLSASTWIIIAIVILIIIAVIIYIKNKQAELPSDISLNKTLDQNLVSSQVRSVFPLQQGSRGEEVKVLQKYLNSKGEKLVVDGIWGPLTDNSTSKVLKVTSVSIDLYKTLS